MTLQERMRELRKERKETQRQVADASTSGLRPGSICLDLKISWALRTTSAYRWIIWPAGRTGGKCRGGFPAVQRNLLLQGAYSLFTKPDIANAPFKIQWMRCA